MSDTASAATYIVAKDGTGNFKTIQEAANVAIAGDTVQVKTGTYNEWVTIKNSGSSGKPITFIAVGTVTVTYPYGSMPGSFGSGLFYLLNKQYVTIDGFRLIGGQVGIMMSSVSYVTIRNNYIENTYQSAILHGYYPYHKADNLLIENNVVNRNADPSTLGYNEIISMSGIRDSIIRNNHVMQNTKGEGIDLKDSSSNVKVYNNLAENARVGVYVDSSNNIEIYNNIALNNGDGGGVSVSNEMGTSTTSNINVHDNFASGQFYGGIGITKYTAGGTPSLSNIQLRNNKACNNPQNFYGLELASVNSNNIVPSPCVIPTWNPGSGCVPSWKCESPLNGYESDGCGNRRAISACNTAASKIKIMPLGDSITYSSYSYREKLWTSLAGAGYQTDFVGSQSSGTNIPDKDNEGHNGWSTVEVNSNIDAWMTSFQPQYILLHIGTNDVSNALFGGNQLSSSQTRLAGIIDKIYAKSPATKVLLATIIPSRDCMTSWNNPADYRCGQNALTGDYNSRVRAVANQKISEGKPVYLVDMYNEAGIDVNSDLFDSVHPNTNGANKMADVWFNHLKTVLASGGAQAPYGGTARAIPGTIQAEDYDNSGEGVAYHDTGSSNSGGQYRTDGVDIEQTTDTGGGYTVAWTRAGEWLKYTVTVAFSGNYNLQARVASNGNGGTFHIEFNGVDKTGPITVPNTGGWQSWQTISKTVYLSAGDQVMKIALDTDGATASVGNINYIRLSQGSANPSPTSLMLKPGWNQISSAVAAGIDLATIEQSCTVLQYKNQKLWAWDAQAQSWINPTKVEPLKGYWIYVAYVCTVPISGTPATFSSLQLYNGWNKISASGTLSVISGTCANHIVGNWIWNWDKTTTPEKWIHPEEMQLDKGYWIKVDADCVLGG